MNSSNSNDGGDEDLEDGEIFDDDDEENKEKETEAKAEEATQPSDFTTNKKDTGNLCTGEGGGTKDSLNPSLVVTSNNSAKNSQNYHNTTWRKTPVDANEEGLDKKNKRSKKRKRRRGDDDDNDGGDAKSEKKKKIRNVLDKEAFASDNANCTDDIHGRTADDEMGGDDEDDDDEMLFVRGASPQHHTHHGNNNNNNRHFKDGFQSDGDNEEMDHDFDDEDDYMENDEDFDDCGDGERRAHSNMSRLDRAGRRDRLSGRGKRRGHGNMGSRKKRDENEVCIFYMQGKCHKGNDCQFSHEAMPHKKQELCKFYLMDCCNKKDKCLYMHSEFPCKYFHMGLKCYANKTCRFSHSKLSESMRQVFVKTFGPIRSKGEFPNKKGATGKHGRPQEPGGDFGRPRDGRRESDGGSGSREKKIPSLFDIKVSIPDEMRKDYNSDSDGGGNRTPMPSPPIDKSQPGQQASDSSRSPPQVDLGAMPSSKRRRKERRNERSLKKANGPRDRENDSDNESASRRLLLPGGPFSNDSWDDIDHEDMLQRLRMEYNNLKDEDSSSNNNSSSFSSNHDRSGVTNSSSSTKSFVDTTASSKIGGAQSFHKSHNKYDSDGSDNSDTLKHEESGAHSDISTSVGGLSANANDSNNEMFPAHLPKKQRELFLRIQQQQRQASESSNDRLQQVTSADGDESKEVGSDGGEDGDCLKLQSEPTSTFSDKLNASKLSDLRSQSDDLNWYSSDEEDYQQSSGVGSAASTSVSAILQNLVRLNNHNSETASLGNVLNSSSFDPQTADAYNSARLTPPVAAVNSTDNGNSTAGISDVDFDVNEVSELLSKVKQHFQANERKVQEKRRDPRLRSDVGPSGDNVNSSSSSSSISSNCNSTVDSSRDENRLPSLAPQSDEDVSRLNATENKGAGAGDMDLRNLPFKPAPVHSAATEIDASINSHIPLPYKLIPIVVPKPDYSSVQLNSKVGAADPRLRKSVRLSEDTSSVVSSRDPRHRLIDDITKNKTNSPSPTPAPLNPDPRQRSRALNAPVSSTDEQLPPTLMLPPSLSHVRPAYPLMPGMDLNAVRPPPSSFCEEPLQPPSYPHSSPMINAPPISRPNDPRQRHSQSGMPPPTTQAQAAALFDVLTAMNSRQPGFLAQSGDPRSRPSGMPNIVFPGAIVRPNNSSVNKGQYGFK